MGNWFAGLWNAANQWASNWFGGNSGTTTNTGTGNANVVVAAGGSGTYRRANRIDITTAIYPDSRTHTGRGQIAILVQSAGRGRLHRRHRVARAAVAAPSPLSACTARHHRRHRGVGAASVGLDLSAKRGAHHADDGAELLLVLALAELVD